MKLNKIIYVFILFSQFRSLTIYKLGGTTLQDCSIKFHDRDWQEIRDCDQTDFDRVGLEMMFQHWI